MTTSEKYAVPNWDAYIGQDNLKETIQIELDAAEEDGTMPGHMLLAGPPGYGKTTLARIAADYLGEEFYAFDMPVDWEVMLNFIDSPDCQSGIVLLDEVHGLSKAQQEALMMGIYVGRIRLKHGREIDTTHVTFVLATTEEHLLIEPLVEKCKVRPTFELYSDAEMREILLGKLHNVHVTLPSAVTTKLARACGGRPRATEDLADAAEKLKRTKRDVTLEAILRLAQLDVDGLSPKHQQYLDALASAKGGQAGLGLLCSVLRMRGNVVENLERLLLQRGYITFERGGRTITPAGRAKLPDQARPGADERRKARQRRKVA